ncbi:carbohydrate sulfotransferase 5-like isoform X2 [Schistocerca piceifrons]|uniref:carbohydrate sulfotransferase 5-like isoform X2 n=2 Tax=Schistocerca TaxID=7008 RepID=UPI001F5E3B90|nr:carbohydrate sulfotransferase 5-like isoform X2 [Schistocerca piceifrons]
MGIDERGRAFAMRERHAGEMNAPVAPLRFHARRRSTAARQAEGMSRRRSVCGVALICSIGVLMLLASQRLVSTANMERTPFIDIGRTIQQWSSNEIDIDEPVNYTKEISDVVSEMRQIIGAEMEDYQYPNGLYNVTARSLADLVPELGGQPIRNLVITTWRSGSTFLGDVLNSHPGNFYHYEPLLDYDIVRIREEPSASEAVRILKALLNCNYTGLDHYLEYGKYHVWLFTHNTRLWEQCQQHPSLCWLPEFLNPFCRLFPFQSMKTVRLKLSLAERLLADKSLNVRVLLLVRDPRGTLQSRKHRSWCPGSPDCSEPRILCSDLVADYESAKEFAVKYPNHFRVVRYEDLSVTPYRSVKELFQFFGLDFHPNVQKFLDTHTKVDVGGVSSTYRNSKSAPFHWRQDLSFLEVRAIQRHCKQAMDSWGYVEAFNSTHQREFNPLSDYKLA